MLPDSAGEHPAGAVEHRGAAREHRPPAEVLPGEITEHRGGLAVSHHRFGELHSAVGVLRNRRSGRAPPGRGTP